MSSETFKSFEDFKNYLTGSPIKNSSKEDILGKVEGIINNIKWKETTN